jgi:radical SAM superfamily enzyme YgiQ (UPF0313 family)
MAKRGGKMRVLIVSSNRLRIPVPAFPSGPAYIAGAVLEAGHEVEVFDCFFSQDVTGELKESIQGFRPEVVGISIRNVHSGQLLYHRDFRGDISEIVDVVKKASSAPIVLGGPGFTNFGREWLEYLELDYGISGEGEVSFPLYLEELERGEDIRSIPGGVYRENGDIHEVPRQLVEDLDSIPLAAFGLFDIDAYRQLGTFPSLFTQRGCPFRCSYCPRSVLDGTSHRLKSPERLADEVEHAKKSYGIGMFCFTDNVFNFPKGHAEAVCRELIRRGLDVKWWTDAVNPVGMSLDFCLLMKEAGCMLPNLSVESCSPRILKNMNRRYSQEQIVETASNLEKAGIPFSTSLLFGSPGETPVTVAETLDLMDRLPRAQMVFSTIGLNLEHHQGILEDARRDGQLGDDKEMFEGAYYMSPHLSEEYIDELKDRLAEKDNWFVLGAG